MSRLMLSIRRVLERHGSFTFPWVKKEIDGAPGDGGETISLGIPLPSPEKRVQRVDDDTLLTWSTFQKHLKYLNSEAKTHVREAFIFGKKVHAGQFRKSGDPYFTHCIEVAHALALQEADEETLVASLLHDVIEDTDVKETEIAALFGERIATIVQAVTKLGKGGASPGSTPREQRIETLRKMFTYMQEDIRIVVIKLFDRLHNMQTLHALPPEKQKQKAEETLEVYVKVASRLCMKELRDKLEFLALRTLHPDRILLLQREQEQRRKDMEKIVQHVRGVLLAEATDLPMEFSPLSLRWAKLLALQRERELDEGVNATLPYALTIITRDQEDCYRVLYHLHHLWQREILSFDDFINCPQISGYQGLHTTIVLQDGRRVQCKIRTERMDDYAKRGIIQSCFSGAGTSSVDWLASTLTLSQGLKRSEDFWLGLQSDILGESTLIHGPGDQVILLPKDSTALDGAFHCFGTVALRTKTLYLNGRPVPFATSLKYADTLTAELAHATLCDRQWLEFVKTGLAVAKIRKALAAESRDKKITIGRTMLQDILRGHGRGLLEEFDERSMEQGLHSIGFSSLDEACIAVAEGLFEPQEVYSAIFEREVKKRELECDRRSYLVRFSIGKDDIDTLRRLVILYQKYGVNLGTMKLDRVINMNKRQFFATMHLTVEECQALKQNLTALGIEKISIEESYSRTRYVLGIASLFFIWGIDPVVARLLVKNYSIAPVDLTLIRFWTLTVLCGLVLTWKLASGGLRREVSIPLRNPWLWLSSILLVIVSLTSYTALQQTWPSHYTIFMTAAGLVLTSIQNARRLQVLVGMWSLFTAGVLLLVFGDSSWSLHGIFFTGLAVLSFTAFSIVSERYKRQEHVSARALQYFFVLSFFCLFLSYPLLGLNTIATIPLRLLFGCILFSIFISSLPYYLYYNALTYRQIDFVLRFSFLIIFASVVGQMVVFGEISRVVLGASALVMLGALLPIVFNWFRPLEAVSEKLRVQD